MIHKLKIEDNYLKNILSGKKKVEIRYNDRDYQVGDILEFVEYGILSNITFHLFKITHIHSGLGMTNNFVALSIQKSMEEKEG